MRRLPLLNTGEMARYYDQAVLGRLALLAALADFDDDLAEVYLSLEDPTEVVTALSSEALHAGTQECLIYSHGC